MSKRIFQAQSFTPTAQVDGILSTITYMGLKGATATGVMQIGEVYEGGQATSSQINSCCLARSSTLAITPTALALPNSDGQMSTQTDAPATVPVCFVTASTGPNRSPATTIARLNLAFNCFGGVVRWQANPGSEWQIFGNAVNAGETLLSSTNTGTAGAMAAHFIYEVL